MLTCETCSNKIYYDCFDTDPYSGNKFDIYFCKNCSIGKTSLKKQFDFSPYYPKKYYGTDGKKFNFLAELIILFFRHIRSSFCYRLFNKKDIKLLDVGCGSGQFIYLMKKKGWSVYGTEASLVSASAAKKKVGEN